MNTLLRRASAADIDALMPLVRDYHVFEGIESDTDSRTAALTPLLEDDSVGQVHFIVHDAQVVGYVALCFGYSIEFGGRDAFVDELFVVPSHRNRGLGRTAMTLLLGLATALRVRAVHLEVQPGNAAAKRLYESLGFEARDRYLLMTRR